MNQQTINTIIVYTNSESAQSDLLVRAVSQASNLSVKNARSHETLKTHIERVPTSEIAIVYAVYDKHDLLFIQSLRESVKNSKLILVLPDNDERTYSEGLLANPSFITCAYNNFGDVSAVVKKIANITDRIQ